MSPINVLTILAMAVVTYATRAGGLWLLSRVTPTARVEAWLRQIPGAVLVALVAPLVATGGPAAWLATAATVGVMARTGNMIMALLTGVGTVALLRLWL